MKKILITDAGSPVGVALISRLTASSEPCEITALCFDKRDYQTVPNTQVVYHQLRTFNKESVEPHLQGVNVIYHLMDTCIGDDKAIFEYNFFATQTIVTLAIKHGVERMLLLSSILSMYDKSEQANLQTEKINELPADADVYAHSKYLAEIELHRAMAEGVQGIIVAPSLVLHQDKIAMQIKWIKKTLQKSPQGKTGYVWIQDLVSLMQKLMQSKVHDQKVIISAENIATKDLCDYLVAYNRQPQHKGKMREHSSEGMLSYYLRHFSDMDCVADTTKIRTLFPKFFFTTLQEEAVEKK